MGEIPGELRAEVKVQLLAFLLYSTLGSLQQLAAAFGGDAHDYGDDYGAEEPAEQLLPGPHAALRALFWLDAGAEIFLFGSQMLQAMQLSLLAGACYNPCAWQAEEGICLMKCKCCG